MTKYSEIILSIQSIIFWILGIAYILNDKPMLGLLAYICAVLTSIQIDVDKCTTPRAEIKDELPTIKY